MKKGQGDSLLRTHTHTHTHVRTYTYKLRHIQLSSHTAVIHLEHERYLRPNLNLFLKRFPRILWGWLLLLIIMAFHKEKLRLQHFPVNSAVMKLTESQHLYVCRVWRLDVSEMCWRYNQHSAKGRYLIISIIIIIIILFIILLFIQEASL